MPAHSDLQHATAQLDQVRQEIAKVIVGQQDVVDGVLICLLAGGHVLLEGVPGLGKTTLLRTLARVLHLKYSRIQFTPDLMPADIVGSMIMESDDRGAQESALPARADFSPIWCWRTRSTARRPRRNRRCSKRCRSAPSPAAPPRTSWKPPFLVMATQNPIEMEGTYPLPEAQLDRFLMKILVTLSVARGSEPHRRAHHPARRSAAAARCSIATRSWSCARSADDVLVAPHVQDYAIDLVMATQPGTAGRARTREQIHPLRKFAARRAGAGRMRPGAGADAGPRILSIDDIRGRSRRRCCGIASF